MAESFAGTTIDGSALAAFVRSAPGLFRVMSETGEEVKVEAQSLVGIGHPPPAGALGYGPAIVRKPGTLRDSIVKRVTERGGYPVVLIGSDDPIALIHHQGTEPHDIRPRNAKVLVFWSTRDGRVIAVPIVHHPGTDPNPYLTDALDNVANRRG